MIIRRVLIQSTTLTFLILTCMCYNVFALEAGSGSDAITQLNMRDHMRYMDVNGGRFRPDEPLKRGEVARMLYVLLTDKPAEPEDLFTDVAETDYKLEANALGTLRIMVGNNGQFRPHDSLTRAEFAATLTRFFPKPASSAAHTFHDVPADHWGGADIASAAEKGWLTGYPDGSFKPDKPITRAEAAVVMNKVLGRSADQETAVNGEDIRILLDTPQSHWAFFHVLEATIGHEYTKNPQGAEQWASWEAESSGLSPGLHFFEGELYCVNDVGRIVRSTEIGGRHYDKDGRYTTREPALDSYLTTVILKNTNDGMSLEEKRRALFIHIRDSYSYLQRPLVAKDEKGWEIRYALRFFREGLGNCYSYAAAYGMLLRKIGWDVEFIVGEITYTTSLPFEAHGWVEIQTGEGIRIDDPEFEMFLKDRNFYNFTYETQPAFYRK